MKILSRVVLFIAVALIGYGYWGAFTRSGNKIYDEMDGYFPFFMMIGGVILLIVFFVMVIVKKRRRNR